MSSSIHRFSLSKKLTIAFFVIFIFAIAFSIKRLSNEYDELKSRSFEDLKSLAQLKSDQIFSFMNEEGTKLSTLIKTDFLKSELEKFFEGRNNIEKLQNYLNQVRTIKNLEDVILIDKNGIVQLSLNFDRSEIDSITLKNFSNIKTDKFLVDIFRIPKSGVVYAFQFPIYKESTDNLFGFVRFQYDALSTIIPRVEYFEPFSSKEILLMKIDDNQITYISFLRKVPIKPFNLLEAINNSECFTQIRKQENCFYEGLDYAGKPILANFTRIKNTDWYLMAKIDREEVFRNFLQKSFETVLLLIFVFLFVGLNLRFIITRHALLHAKRELELKHEKESTQTVLNFLMKEINDVVFVLDNEGKIVQTNQKVEKLYGYKPEELIGKTIDVVCKVNEMQELYERFKQIENSEGLVYESNHCKKDGSLFEVEVSAKSIEFGGNKYLFGMVRDISERKKIISELQSKLEVESQLMDITSKFLNLNAQNFDEEIIKIFNDAGNFLKVDRVRFFYNQPDSKFYNCEVEWCKIGIEPFIDKFQFLDLENDFPFLFKKISSGVLYNCFDIDQLPSEAERERKVLSDQGIKSFIWRPLKHKGVLIGFLSTSSTEKKNLLNSQSELFVNIFSEIFINTYFKVDNERKILESERKFRKLIENSSDVILVVSKDFKNTFLSSSSTKLLGYSIEERMNQNPLELIHPDDIDFVKESLAKLKEPGSKITIKFRGRHKFGHYLWLEATITNMYYDPLFNGLIVNYHDITETVETYKKLQESEERYRLLAEESGDVLYKLNYATMRYEYLSPVIKKLTGYSSEEIEKIGFNSIIEEIYLLLSPGKSIEEIKEDRIKGTTGEYLADYKIKTKNGDIKWIRDHSFPVFDKDGKLTGSIGILTDVTEIKIKEEEIKKREKYLDVLVDIQKALIFLEDLKNFYNYMLPKLGEVTGASRCYVFENSKDEKRRLLMSQVAEWCREGITPQIDNPQLQNLPYDELGIDLVQDMLQRGYWAAIVKDLPEPTRTILKSQDIVSILLIPIMIKDEFYGFIGFDECVSEREWNLMEIDVLKSAAASIALAIEELNQRKEIIKARDEAVEANRLRSSFLSLLSHEIRTPLNSILGYTDVLKDLFLKPDNLEVAHYFEIIEKGGKRLLNTINQLIEMSKLEAGELKVTIKVLDLKKYIDEVVSELKVQADQKNLKIVTRMPDEDVLIKGDEYCVHGILENLISNAIKYSDRGTIEISVNLQEEDVELIVKDEGIGISEEYLKHLFKPFSQEDVTYKRKFEGTGLGLAITKKYIDLIGGDIKVWSQKGKGSIFTVKFRRKLISSNYN